MANRTSKKSTKSDNGKIKLQSLNQNILHLDPETLECGGSPMPRRALINNIKMRGVLVPIFVARTAKSYKVIAGLRRRQSVIIARKELELERTQLQGKLPRKPEAQEKKRLRLEEIESQLKRLQTLPAIETGDDKSLTLIENANRSRNPLHEYEQIEQYIKDNSNLSEKDVFRLIVKETGMTPGQIQARLRFRNLIEPLKLALGEGKITVGVAEAASRLTADEQGRAVKILDNTHKLRAKDMKEILSVAITEGERQMSFTELMTDIPSEFFSTDQYPDRNKPNKQEAPAPVPPPVKSPQPYKARKAVSKKTDTTKDTVKLEFKEELFQMLSKSANTLRRAVSPSMIVSAIHRRTEKVIPEKLVTENLDILVTEGRVSKIEKPGSSPFWYYIDKKSAVSA